MAHTTINGPIPDNVVVCTNSENIAFIDSGIISDTDTVYSIAQVNCISSDAAVVLTDDTQKEDSGCVTVEQMLSMDLSVDISSSGSTIDIMSTSCGDCDQQAPSVVSEEQLVDYSYDQQVTTPGCVPILVELPNGQVIQVMGEAAPSDTACKFTLHYWQRHTKTCTVIHLFFILIKGSFKMTWSWFLTKFVTTLMNCQLINL